MSLSPHSHSTAYHSQILLPLDDLSPDLMAAAARHSPSAGGTRPRGGASPASVLLDPSAPSGGVSASVDLQRSLVQQQAQQAQRELRKMKEELYETSRRLGEASTALNEQRMEYSSLSHRYGAAVEKLTSAEGDVKKLEEQLVQERQRAKGIREERESVKLELRDANWQVEKLQRRVEELAANKGLDQREVQRLLGDRSQYLPTVEVRRLEMELHSSQQSLVERIVTALDALLSRGEEGETAFFVARSGVLAAATDLEARVLRAESALENVYEQLSHFKEETEKETCDFALALMTENKELWQHLTKLQSEHDLLGSELDLQRRRGEVVPRDAHDHVLQQLRVTTDRLEKAQQVVEALTTLAREHEEGMQGLMQQSDEMAEELEQLRHKLEAERASSAAKTAALQEADTALGGATRQVEDLQVTLQTERRRADEAIKDINETNDAITAEYEQRVRRLQADLTASSERGAGLEKQLEESRETAERLQQALADSEESFRSYKQQSAQTMAQQQQQQLTELERVRAMLVEEVETLRRGLEEAREESRAAVRDRDEASAKAQTLEATRRALETDLQQQREESERQRQHLAEVVDQLRAVSAELEEVRAEHGEGGTHARELQKTVERLTRERDEGTARLAEEQQRAQQRCEQLQRDWKAAEKARVALQEEVKVLRGRCAAAEAARQSEEHQQQDREQLMQANLKLHEQYQSVQEESRRLTEQLRALQGRQDASHLLQQQVEELQVRLRELPQLRQAADDARREMLKAREETELISQERDKMAARLDLYLQDSKSAAAKDDEFGRIVRDASEAVKRLSGQVYTAKARGKSGGGDYHVFSNTRASPTRGTGYAAASGGGGGGASARRADAAAGTSVESSAHKEGGGGGSSGRQMTPQRPWKN